MNNIRLGHLFILFILVNLSAMGQNIDTLYFNKKGKEVRSPAKAEYFREIKRDQNGKPEGWVLETYMDGTAKWDGKLSGEYPDVLEGTCSWYDKEGILLDLARYESSQRIDEWPDLLRLELEKLNFPYGIFKPNSEIYLHELGVKLYIAGYYDEAVSSLLLGARIASQKKRFASEATIYNDLGNLVGQFGYPSVSLIYQTRAMKIWKRLTKTEDLIHTMNSMGNAHLRLTQLDEAEQVLLEAKQLGEARLSLINLSIPTKLVTTYLNLGAVYHKKGNYDLASHYLKKAESKAKVLNLDKELAICFHSQSTLKQELGENLEGLSLLKKSLSLWQDQGNSAEINSLHTDIGVIYNNLGEYQQALEYFLRAQAQADSLDWPYRSAFSHTWIGYAHHQMGHHESAIHYLLKSLSLFSEFEIDANITNALHFLALAYEAIGNDQKAISHLERALRIHQSLDQKLGEALIQNNIGNIHIRNKDYDLAIKAYLKALKLMETLNAKIELATTFNNLASAFEGIKEFPMSISYHHKALSIRKDLNLKQDQAYSFNNLGALYLQIEKYDSAQFYLEKSLSIRKDIGAKRDLSMTYALLGYCHYEEERFTKAIQLFDQSLELNQHLFRSAKGDLSKLNSLNDATDIIDVAIECNLLENHSEKAFYLSEKLKGRLLNQYLKEARIKNAKIPFPLSAEKDSIDRDIRKWDSLLTTISNSADQAYFLDKKSASIQHKRIIKAKIREIVPEYTNLNSFNSVPLDSLQELLAEGEVILSFHDGYNYDAFLITKSGFNFFPLAPRSYIDSLIHAFRYTYIEVSKDALRKSNFKEKQRLSGIFYHISRALYKELIFPIKKSDLIENKKLIIIPAGNLHTVPFETLISDSSQKPFKDYNYLVKQHQISYFPSIFSFFFMRSSAPYAPESDLEFTGVALTDFTQTQCKDETGNSFMNLSVSLEQTSSFFSPSRCRILKDGNATESTLKQKNFGHSRYIHFITHAEVFRGTPDYSKIVLQSDTTNTGCLELHEIYDLDWNADLISLAACETGLGHFNRGEGMIGFSHGFFYAGTRSIVLSLWPVQDRSTQVFFDQFYERLQLREGRGKYNSFREAQLNMISGEKFSNPYYWGAFLFLGEK